MPLYPSTFHLRLAKTCPFRCLIIRVQVFPVYHTWRFSSVVFSVVIVVGVKVIPVESTSLSFVGCWIAGEIHWRGLNFHDFSQFQDSSLETASVPLHVCFNGALRMGIVGQYYEIIGDKVKETPIVVLVQPSSDDGEVNGHAVWFNSANCLHAFQRNIFTIETQTAGGGEPFLVDKSAAFTGENTIHAMPQ